MRVHATMRRFLLYVAILAAAAGAGWTQASESDRPLALLAVVDGPIGPGTAHFVSRAVDTAQQRDAEVLVLRLDTPGGLATSMRDVIARILSSEVPVIGYVAPPGAHAASAGTYILYATPLAAMAPGTNIGAATPVQIGGGGLPGLPSSKDEPQKPSEDGETVSLPH